MFFILVEVELQASKKSKYGGYVRHDVELMILIT